MKIKIENEKGKIVHPKEMKKNTPYKEHPEKSSGDFYPSTIFIKSKEDYLLIFEESEKHLPFGYVYKIDKDCVKNLHLIEIDSFVEIILTNKHDNGENNED